MTATSGRVMAYAGMTIGAVGSVAANVAVAFIPPAPVAPDTLASDLTRAQIDQLAHRPFTPNIVQIIWGVIIAVALFVAVQVLERIDWPKGKGWLAVRVGGAAVVAGVAGAWSYYHLTTLLLNSLPERTPVATGLCYFGSAIVEGLMALCSAGLIASTVAPSATPEDASAGDESRTPAEAHNPAPAPPPADVAAPERADRSADPGADRIGWTEPIGNPIDRAGADSPGEPISDPIGSDSPTRFPTRSSDAASTRSETRSDTRSTRRGSGRRSGRQSKARTRSDAELWAELEQAIELGFVDRSKPTADAIRVALQCAPGKARSFRDALTNQAAGEEARDA